MQITAAAAAAAEGWDTLDWSLVIVLRLTADHVISEPLCINHL